MQNHWSQSAKIVGNLKKREKEDGKSFFYAFKYNVKGVTPFFPARGTI